VVVVVVVVVVVEERNTYSKSAIPMLDASMAANNMMALHELD
jgi:hypothetical protein